MDLRELNCKEGRCKEAGEDSVQWWVLALSLLYLQVILPESHFFRSGGKYYFQCNKIKLPLDQFINSILHPGCMANCMSCISLTILWLV